MAAVETSSSMVGGTGARNGLRALVLSADVGESHAAMARVLVDDLARRPDVADVSWVNDFSVLGPILGTLLPRGFGFHLGRVKWSYDLAYHLFTRLRPALRFGERALYALGGSALANAIAHREPDVVVSTYPVMNPVLSGLRLDGRLRAPVLAVVGPLAGHDYWVQPGIDLHMTIYPEALPAVELRSGAGRARAIRPLVREDFFRTRRVAEARSRLDLPPGQPIVFVSGGGWGAGDLTGVIEAALALLDVFVVAAVGRNHTVREALARRFSAQGRVRILGFTDRMRDLLCAADVFVTTTAGLSCLEARLCGCPIVCYGFQIGHVRDNTRALRDHGVVRTATSSGELIRELEAALEAGRRAPWSPGELPTAAELTVGLALAARGRGGGD